VDTDRPIICSLSRLTGPDAEGKGETEMTMESQTEAFDSILTALLEPVSHDEQRFPAAPDTTLAYLVSRPAPLSLPDTRLPFERHIFRVKAAVTLVRRTADEDFHLVLSDEQRTLIAESPSAACTQRAIPYRRRQMTQARQAVTVSGR